MKSKRKCVLHKYYRLLNEYVSTPVSSIDINNAEPCADIYTTQNLEPGTKSSFAGLLTSLKKKKKLKWKVLRHVSLTTKFPKLKA